MVPVTGVTVTPAEATVNVGATRQLTATVAPADATNKAVTWTSGNATVATVVYDGDGQFATVTGVAAGQATIIARTTDGNFTAIVNVVLRLPGDATGDGKVDASDLTLVAGAFNTQDAASDINADGIVDIFDLVLVGRNFGRR